MFYRVSSSAARKFVVSVATLFVVTGVVGAIERMLYQNELLMAVVPQSLIYSALIVGIGLYGVLYRSKWCCWLSGLSLLAVLGTVAWLIEFEGNVRLIALPLSYVAVLLCGTALLFFVKPDSKLGRAVWRFCIACSSLIFFFIQASVWGLFSDNALAINQANFIALSLISVLVSLGAIALGVLMHTYNDNYRPSSRSQVIIIAMTIIGVSIWYTLNLNELRSQSEKAETKIDLIAQMIDATLETQSNIAKQMQQRFTTAQDEATLARLIELDTTSFEANNPIVRGFILYDAEQNVLMSNGYATEFLAADMLNSDRFSEWIAAAGQDIRLVIHGASLTTADPIFIISTPFETPHGEPRQLLTLLDVNKVIATQYLSYFDSMETYLEFSPQLLISMQGSASGTLSLAELMRQAPHFITSSAAIAGSAEMNFHSVLRDYAEIQNSAQLDQLLLWLTFAFVFIYILAEDNSQRAANRQHELAYLAKHDDITGLLRRDSFNAILAERDRVALRKQRSMLFVNLDGFKPINDSIGHALGDKVLYETARRIEHCAPAGSVLARFSGDEFLVYFEPNQGNSANECADCILQAVRKPYEIDGIDIHLSASIGNATNEELPIEALQLIQHAEIAMSQAKRLGGNLTQHFMQAMARDYQQQVRLRNALQIALDRKDFEVYYQPIFNTADHTITGVESLVRWNLDGEFVSPAEFIKIAESTGQIIPLGEQVLDLVLADIQRHPQLQSIKVTVNVSAQQLQRYNFPKFLAERLAFYQVAARNLTLELTEGVFAGETVSTIAALQQLRDMGCHVAIDDFGTGFSSLSYLNRLPADIIKIDRVFTHGIADDPELFAVVQKIIELCRHLQKRVIVEGIEDEVQLNIFTQLGVERVQGFFFAHPMPIEQLLKRLVK
ncbi:putative bifunctional diguanylate cyclase/phosphodiesterase [Pseudidiomarina aquimaris]|uniref:putative bifunctional diguanylate cyclase/phosphodiesterase n=1 Tax=Pseudidiomarina aquimaris TaxID=641841 RepID=UPI003A975CA1